MCVIHCCKLCGFKTKIMDKYKIKDYTERLKKETYKNAQKMLYMWIKQDVISLNEYRTLVKNIEVIPCCTELKTFKENKTLELQNELNKLNEDLEFEMDEPQIYKIGRLILEEKIKLLTIF